MITVESSFRFRLIGPKVLDVVFLSKLVFAVVLGARIRSILELDGVLIFDRVFNLSNNTLSFGKTVFIFLSSKIE